jgi:hypothetical protein
MGRPKKNRAESQRASVSSDEGSQGDKLDVILEKLSKLDSITTKLAKLETMLTATQAENKLLKETVASQNSMILELKDKVNSLEQHGRSFSIRVNNLSLEGVDEKDPPAVIKKVFDTVFLPILQGAASKQAISSVPSCFECIEMAHPLPARGAGPKPIIVRFFNRNIKSLLFKHRKEFASKDTSSRPRYIHPFFDDLTRDTFSKMKVLQSDPRVESCWSTGGNLRVKLADSGVIKRVTSIYLSNDDILK